MFNQTVKNYIWKAAYAQNCSTTYVDAYGCNKLPSSAGALYTMKRLCSTPLFVIGQALLSPNCVKHLSVHLWMCQLHASSTHLGGAVGWGCWFHCMCNNTLSTACTSKQKQVVSIGSYFNVLVLGSLCGVINFYIPLYQGCTCCSTFLLILTETMYAALPSVWEGFAGPMTSHSS